jgi:hypothetical protein
VYTKGNRTVQQENYTNFKVSIQTNIKQAANMHFAKAISSISLIRQFLDFKTTQKLQQFCLTITHQMILQLVCGNVKAVCA